MDDGDEHDEEVRHAILYSKQMTKDGAMLAELLSESAASVVTRMPVDILKDSEKVAQWRKDYDDMLEHVLKHGAMFGRASLAELGYDDAFPANAACFEEYATMYDKHGYSAEPGFDGGMFFDALPKLPSAYSATGIDRVGPAGMPSMQFYPSRQCCKYVNGLEEEVVAFGLAHGRRDHVDFAVGTSVEMHAMLEEQRQFSNLNWTRARKRQRRTFWVKIWWTKLRWRCRWQSFLLKYYEKQTCFATATELRTRRC